MSWKNLIGSFLFFIFVSFSFATGDFESYKNEQLNSFKATYGDEFKTYKTNTQNQYKAYKKAYDIEFKNYKNNISKYWGNNEVSTKHKWVQYGKKYKSKKVVDFKNKIISIEVIAQNQKEARKKLSNVFKQIIKDDVKTAIKNDQLEQKISKRLNKKIQLPKINQPIIEDIIDKKTKKNYIKAITKGKLKSKKYKNNMIYTITLKMPPNSILKKAKLYKSTILKNSTDQNIKQNLIYAIIHSESSFNPMARSHIPAFGLMQIVPKSAGVDSYYFLYGKKKILNSSYLYDSSNNIKIGSAYLHILYYRYLKDIKNPTSRLLCVICAYNTGSGNVAKTFIGSFNTKKASKIINKMTTKQVYKKLMRSLPYLETRKYLKKVYDRTINYEKLLKSEQI